VLEDSCLALSIHVENISEASLPPCQNMKGIGPRVDLLCPLDHRVIVCKQLLGLMVDGGQMEAEAANKALSSRQTEV